MKKELIVAKYKEDISWINQITDTYDNIYIYDKSLPSQYFNNNVSPYENKKISLISLPNIGRESHTYLHHIINNYDNLSDIITFSQGNPFDHCRDFIDRVRNIDKEVQDPKQYSAYYGRSSYCDGNGQGPETGIFSGKPNPLADIFNILFPNTVVPEKFIFCFGALFSISKELILQHNKEFYIKIINIASYGGTLFPISILTWYEAYQKMIYGTNDPGHAFERLWPYIFIKD